ncbi:MAG: hypothetical protein E6I84_01710 [Chloroflexi bacterium]|nr:MAG: hypothetical protein E6I84_01710 [Chloroflexota bacterium]
MRIDLFDQAQAITHGEPLPCQLTAAAPVVVHLRSPRQCIEGHALQIRVVQTVRDFERVFRAGVGALDFFRRRLSARAADPEREKALGREIRGQGPLVCDLIGDGARVAP